MILAEDGRGRVSLLGHGFVGGSTKLTAVEVRVLGALMEKEMTTPENYPLSLNSLVAACNQRSSREPVMELAEDEVRQALHGLEERGWTAPVREGRVPRYEHRVRTVLQLRRDETAVLCVLLLRGAQTVGELRGRAERMYSFDDLQAVGATLERMAGRGLNPAGDGVEGNTGSGEMAGAGRESTGPLVVLLPRQTGSREARYMHLLGGPVEMAEATVEGRRGPEARASGEEGVAELRAEMAALREICAGLERRVLMLEERAGAGAAENIG